MADYVGKSELDAKLEASEARIETRLTQMQADFDTRFNTLQTSIQGLAQQMDASLRDSQELRAETRSTRTTVLLTGITTMVAVIGVMIALAAMFSDMQGNIIMGFQSGVAVRETGTAVSQPPPAPAAARASAPVAPALPVAPDVSAEESSPPTTGEAPNNQ